MHRLTMILVVLAAHGCDDDHGPNSSDDAEFEQIVLQRASIEFPCPQDELEAVALGGYAYRASGCGEYATYECYLDPNEGEHCDRATQDGPSLVDAGM